MSKFNQWKEQLGSIVNLREHMDVERAAETIEGNIYFRGPNVYILFCAIIIASLGLNVNSIPVIIGAMLVSPLMGPIVGLGFALGTNNTDLMRASLRHLAVMVSISIAASTLYFLLTPLRLENPSELLARTNPTIYDVMIAFFGGIAGILETSRKEKGTVLAGVAIATALMPPLCTIGFGIATWNFSYAGGALYLFFINSVFIALASFLGVKYLRFPVKTYRDQSKQHRVQWVVTIGVIIIIIPSIMSAISVIRQNNFERDAESYVASARKAGGVYIYDYRVDHSTSPAHIELVVAGGQMDAVEREQLYVLASEYGIKRSQLTFNQGFVNDQKYNDDLLERALQHVNLRQQKMDSLAAYYESQLATYKKDKLPTAQIATELRSLYPSVREVTIAQGEVSKSATDSTDMALPKSVVVVVEARPTLSRQQRTQVEQWLAARLEREDVRLIVE